MFAFVPHRLEKSFLVNLYICAKFLCLEMPLQFDIDYFRQNRFKWRNRKYLKWHYIDISCSVRARFKNDLSVHCACTQGILLLCYKIHHLKTAKIEWYFSWIKWKKISCQLIYIFGLLLIYALGTFKLWPKWPSITGNWYVVARMNFSAPLL